MKLARPFIMYALVAFALVSCMAVNPHKQLKKHIDLNVDYFPSIQRVIDTTKKDTAKHSETLPVKEIKTLIVKGEAHPDTCIEHKLNIQWQELTLRLLDSARNRKQGKDSVLILLKQQRADMAAMRKENAEGFAASKRLNEGYNEVMSKLMNISIFVIAISYGFWGLIWLFKRMGKKPTIA